MDKESCTCGFSSCRCKEQQEWIDHYNAYWERLELEEYLEWLKWKSSEVIEGLSPSWKMHGVDDIGD